MKIWFASYNIVSHFANGVAFVALFYSQCSRFCFSLLMTLITLFSLIDIYKLGKFWFALYNFVLRFPNSVAFMSYYFKWNRYNEFSSYIFRTLNNLSR